MLRLNQVGNKAGRISATILNGETSATIPRGTPVVLKLSATAVNADDGLKVVLPSTAGDPVNYFGRYGICTDTMTTGQQSEAILFGVCPYSLVTLATRAASTNSWTSSASIASGVALGLDSLNNALLIGASSAGSLPFAGGIFLLDSLASIAASATATTDTRTAITIAARTLVRFM